MRLSDLVVLNAAPYGEMNIQLSHHQSLVFHEGQVMARPTDSLWNHGPIKQTRKTHGCFQDSWPSTTQDHRPHLTFISFFFLNRPWQIKPMIGCTSALFTSSPLFEPEEASTDLPSSWRWIRMSAWKTCPNSLQRRSRWNQVGFVSNEFIHYMLYIINIHIYIYIHCNV
jgi:hypothetical protein